MIIIVILNSHRIEITTNNKKTRVVYSTYIGIEPFTIHDLDVPTFQIIYFIVANGNDIRCAL